MFVFASDHGFVKDLLFLFFYLFVADLNATLTVALPGMTLPVPLLLTCWCWGTVASVLAKHLPVTGFPGDRSCCHQQCQEELGLGHHHTSMAGHERLSGLRQEGWGVSVE